MSGLLCLERGVTWVEWCEHPQDAPTFVLFKLSWFLLRTCISTVHLHLYMWETKSHFHHPGQSGELKNIKFKNTPNSVLNQTYFKQCSKTSGGNSDVRGSPSWNVKFQWASPCAIVPGETTVTYLCKTTVQLEEQIKGDL